VGNRVGILELTAVPAVTWSGRMWNAAFASRYASVMSQAVGAWLRQAGHSVHYAVYRGVDTPLKMLPECDVVFVVTTSRTAAIARRVGLSIWSRRQRMLVVACGPYAAGNPSACREWADIAIGSCDKAAVLSVGGLEVDPGSVVDRAFDVSELPSLRDRADFVRATFVRGSLPSWRLIPLLESVGCPNSCEFCTEHDRRYSPLPMDRVEDDLHTAAELFPGSMVAWHDPNWGVRRERYLRAMQSVRRTNMHIVELEMRHLDGDMMARLHESGIGAVACGIESFSDYGEKAGTGGKVGREKMEHVIGRLRDLQGHVPYVQANFIVGLDGETVETWTLLEEAIRATPGLWWNVTPAYPFAGTPLRTRWQAEGRLLDMPPEFQCAPMLTHRLESMTADQFYWRLRGIYLTQLATARRWTGPRRMIYTWLRARFAHEAVRVLEIILRDATAVRRYHEDRGPWPGAYERLRQLWLGPYLDSS